MARNSFNMNTVLKVQDLAAARAKYAAEKDKQFHHTLMLGQLIELGEATCAQLEAWLEANKATLMDEAHRKPWDKYSAGCHMAYFVNRVRGPITAWTPEGAQVVQTATKVKKAPAAEAPEAPAVEAPAVEAPVAVDPIEAQLAELEG